MPAPLLSVPPGNACSAVLLEAAAVNMQTKQAAALLITCPDIQPTHAIADEGKHTCPPPKMEQMWFGEM